MDDGGLGAGGRQRVDHDRQGLEIQGDQVGCITGLLARFGDDEADQVTREADLGRIEQRSIRQAAPSRAADGKARCVRKLSGGNDRDDSRSGAGRRDID